MFTSVNEVLETEALRKLRNIIFCERECSKEDLETRIADLNEFVESLKPRPGSREGCG